VVIVSAALSTAATRTGGRPRTRFTTPLRLRLWTASAVTGALAVLLIAGLGMARLQDEVRVIGSDAARRAATASDLYFALSDLDAQVARLVLIDRADALSSSGLDALRAYQRRGAQITADVSDALASAGTDDAGTGNAGTDDAGTDDARDALRRLTDQLAEYRRLAWQAITVEGEQPARPAGAPPAAALGYYAHATTVMRFELLPTAKLLRDSSQARLAGAYHTEERTAVWSVVLLLVSGTALVVLLGLLQRRLARHYRRLVNPALLLATLATALLVGTATVIFLDETHRLRSAQTDAFAPYLALTQAQAVSYDAAADTTRYLLTGNLGYYQQDFQAKSGCLARGGGCGADGEVLSGGLATLAAVPGVSGARAQDLAERWSAYARDHQRIVGLAETGRVDAAVDILTGIRRGDAAFDFFYFDAALTGIAADRRRAFETALAGGSR
jgi:hypothetical protein